MRKETSKSDFDTTNLGLIAMAGAQDHEEIISLTFRFKMDLPTAYNVALWMLTMVAMTQDISDEQILDNLNRIRNT
jgi:hypothetical protein